MALYEPTSTVSEKRKSRRALTAYEISSPGGVSQLPSWVVYVVAFGLVALSITIYIVVHVTASRVRNRQ